MEKEKVKNSWFYNHKKEIVLVCVLILQICFAVFWGKQKVGFHEDEIYSYGLSNGHTEPFLCDQEDFYNQWHDADYINEYLTVSENERFSYDRVYYNQTQDVHPPFFYFLLHTVCSLFPGKFTKWFCIGINLVCFSVTVLLIYQFSCKIFRKSWFSVIPSICYGFSIGAIDTIVYLRMYMLLAMLCMLFLRLSQKYWRAHRFRRSSLIYIGITVFLGMLTHYYFAIFLFFTYICYLLFLSLQKRKREVVSYSVTVLIGIIASGLAYPAMMTHIFSGYRGKEALENATLIDELQQKAQNYLEIINNELFGGYFWVTMLGIVIALLICFLFHKYSIRIKPEENGWKLYFTKRESERKGKTPTIYLSKNFPDSFAVGVVSVGYILAIAMLTTVQEDRYIFCVYPMLIIALCAIIWKIIGYLMRNWIVYSVALVIILASNALSFLSGGVSYLYKDDGDAAVAINKFYSSYDCIYVTNNDMGWVVNKDYYLLKHFDRVCFVQGETLDEQKSLLEQNNGRVIVFVTKEYDQESTIQHMTNLLGYTEYSGLYDTGNSMSYAVYGAGE